MTLSSDTHKQPHPEHVALQRKLANLPGQQLLDRLTELLCQEFDADVGAVSLLMDDNSTMRTLSLYKDGDHLDPFSYPLAVAPCNETLHKDFCLYMSMVQTKFPNDIYLRAGNIESYAGVPLVCGSDQVKGTMLIESRSPLADSGVVAFMMLVRSQVQAAIAQLNAP